MPSRAADLISSWRFNACDKPPVLSGVFARGAASGEDRDGGGCSEATGTDVLGDVFRRFGAEDSIAAQLRFRLFGHSRGTLRHEIPFNDASIWVGLSFKGFICIWTWHSDGGDLMFLFGEALAGSLGDL